MRRFLFVALVPPMLAGCYGIGGITGPGVERTFLEPGPYDVVLGDHTGSMDVSSAGTQLGVRFDIPDYQPIAVATKQEPDLPSWLLELVPVASQAAALPRYEIRIARSATGSSPNFCVFPTVAINADGERGIVACTIRRRALIGARRADM